MAELTKTQLVNLTAQVLDKDLPSLKNLTQEDLIQLLQSMCESRSVTKAYLV